MKTTIHCFGATSTSGEALRLISPVSVCGYTRNPSISPEWLHYFDFNDPLAFRPAGDLDSPSIWISFAPIWLLAPFLEKLALKNHYSLNNLRGVIACSSSSVITKRFAVNAFDRSLVSTLLAAEDQLSDVCRTLSIPCRILRPTLIYGQVGHFSDNNLSRLLSTLRRFPILPLPSDSGLRQPIHASQLAALALYLSNQLCSNTSELALIESISVGGDTTLSYFEMIKAIQIAQSSSDPARRCRLFKIPNRLFFLLASLLLLRSPRSFEAVYRMGANLSGFTPVHQILGTQIQDFPVLPLA